MGRRPYTHYGVRIGRRIGVFTDWSDCAEQVSGYSGQCYHGFHSYRDAFDFAYGKPEASPEPLTFMAPEPESFTMPEPFTTSEPETAMAPEPEPFTPPEPQTVSPPEPETVTPPEPGTAATPEPATATESEPANAITPEFEITTVPEPETPSQPRTVLDAELGHQEPPPAKKARHSEEQAREPFSDTQEHTFDSNGIVGETGESSSSATDPPEIVCNDIREAQELLSALMEGGRAVKIIPVSPKRKLEE